ncbi:hypothetical protein [Staphylococcus phage vB_SauH_DELF3]|nr:hypothetical protein [Staphylococcus phage vB_SauH_DELF3]
MPMRILKGTMRDKEVALAELANTVVVIYIDVADKNLNGTAFDWLAESSHEKISELAEIAKTRLSSEKDTTDQVLVTGLGAMTQFVFGRVS